MSSLVFRALEADEVQLLQRLLSGEQAACLPVYVPIPASLAWLRQKHFGDWVPDGRTFLVAEEDGRCVALLLVTTLDPVNRRLEFGIIFDTPETDRWASIPQAFVAMVNDRILIRTLQCPCLPDSETMHALLEAGFKPLVRRREEVFLRGSYHDVLLMVRHAQDK